MADVTRTTRFRFWLWLIRAVGVIVPRRLRADWRREWEAGLRYHETPLAEWERFDWGAKLALLWRSLGAFADALMPITPSCFIPERTPNGIKSGLPPDGSN